MITGKTKLLGVIGYPIAHSLSPVMHNAAIQALGVDYAYLPFAIHPDDLPTAIAGFEAIGLRGFNVTIPHKQSIMPLLSQISDTAQAIGAVNTVYRTDQGWGGTNTDVTGFLAPLQVLDRPWQETIALILGNGGAARAVAAGCAQLGCPAIQVVGRDRQKLEQFQQNFQKIWQASVCKTNLSIHPWSDLPNLLAQAGLIINTTPIGMHPHLDRSPLTSRETEQISSSAIAYDLIYTPRPTQFLQQAEQQGAQAIDGLEMLVQQGAAALQLWLNASVPVEIMGEALIQALA